MKKNELAAFTLLLHILTVPLAGCNRPVRMDKPELTRFWGVVRNLKVTQPLRMAAFLDGDHGITGGFSGAGKTHFTSDGGKKWTLSEESGGCIFGMDIVDGSTLWIAGRKTGASFTTPGGIRLNRDWGGSWEMTTRFPFRPEETPLGFIDDKTGWVFSSDRLSQTTDGGKTLKEIPLPEGVTRIRALQILTAGQGFILDEKAVLHFTDNSGLSWTSRNLMTGSLEDCSLLEIQSVSSAMRFTDPLNGFLVMGLKGRESLKTYLLTTADGGRTCHVEILTDAVGALFISPDRQWITLSDMDSGTITVFGRLP